ncbi:hypothetical protein F383_15316 [Gossypium arboreum]|uniref:Uncharacterized protein n=1 Tax=Gossypium arboreum TaxID=29729 RepID=A0A0B0Q307_GOSAR|nr:hypothetical protein F383_15316 [Gossypium arboreum]
MCLFSIRLRTYLGSSTNISCPSIRLIFASILLCMQKSREDNIQRVLM